MTKKTQLLILPAAIFALSLLLPTQVSAKEGIYNLSSTTSSANECTVYSVFLDDREYHLLLTCRNISFPDGPEVIRYYAWATPVQGGDPIRLGDINFGKEDFRIEEPFSSVFITKETTESPRRPSSNIVMVGNYEPNTHLEDNVVSRVDEDENGENGQEEQQEPRSRFSRLLAASSIFAFIGLFILIFFLFVITRR